MTSETYFLLIFLFVVVEVLPWLAELYPKAEGPQPYDLLDIDDVLRMMRQEGKAEDVRRDFGQWMEAHRYLSVYRHQINDLFRQWMEDRAERIQKTVDAVDEVSGSNWWIPSSDGGMKQVSYKDFLKYHNPAK